MCNHLSFISTTQQTLRPSKKCFSSQNGWEKTSYPGMSAEACRGKHEMQLASKKVYWKNNRVFQTLATHHHWKQQCSKHLWHIATENNRVFQTLVTYHHWKQQSVPNTCDISPLKTLECSKHLQHIAIVLCNFIF